MSKPDSIRIIKPGILSSIRDKGRSGYRHIGIGPGGAMDMFAFSMANLLLHNPENAAALEFHFPAPEIEFISDTTFCITGGDFDARLNGTAFRPWKLMQGKKGDILSFHKIIQGFRGYLAVQGGFEAEEWLGSCSTHILMGRGGHKGRALKKDDIINAVGNNDKGIDSPIKVDEKVIDAVYNINTPLLCTPGPEWNLLNEESKMKIYDAQFKIHSDSNRMAYILSSSTPISLSEKKEMLSSAVLQGTVQLLPDSRFALLMADHQTTGGFPRILQVLESQIPKLAQASPGKLLRLKIIDHNTATEDYLSYMKLLQNGG